MSDGLTFALRGKVRARSSWFLPMIHHRDTETQRPTDSVSRRAVTAPCTVLLPVRRSLCLRVSVVSSVGSSRFRPSLRERVFVLARRGNAPGGVHLPSAGH